MATRYVCLHGHFYQPPRENPWLDAVEEQESAHPFHDWNERITAECYGPNVAARILDGDGYIKRIVSTYERISFNFGPTLLSWLERWAPEVYAAILEADARSVRRFDGHGSALAQVYNHMIMPLANARDRRTQVQWGVADFRRRFGREPEGMWLAETAVDVPSLEDLAEAGIRFTILAPYQAARVRSIDGGAWRDVDHVDPREPYRCELPSGRTIDLFFYDGGFARAVAFENLLNDGDRFAARLLDGFDDREGSQLVHIATDGETYGHHHRHGEMALAYALDKIESAGDAVVTNYGAYLAEHPPRRQVEIAEDTSWSCAHGIERWRSDCGCSSSGGEWNQAWRGPLREALDQLRDALAEVFERHAGALLVDPWAARDAYVDVVLDRDGADAFLEARGKQAFGAEERVQVLELLEMQRFALLMYTSCGWFFDELSRIEGVQILRYAGRAIQLAEKIAGVEVEAAFLETLAAAKSNVPERGDGRAVYESEVRPAMVDLPAVVAQYAASAIFGLESSSSLYAYRLTRKQWAQKSRGRAKVVVGQVEVSSQITGEVATLSFGVLHLGDHNLTGGVRSFEGVERYQAMADAVISELERGQWPEVVRRLDEHFGELRYSLSTLFADERRQIIDQLLAETLRETETIARQIQRHHGPLIDHVASLGHALPGPIRAALQFSIEAELSRALAEPPLDTERVRALLSDAERHGVPVDREAVGFALSAVIDRLCSAWERAPFAADALAALQSAVVFAQSLPFEIDLWRVQNVYWSVRQRSLPPRVGAGAFDRLGEQLRISLDR